MRAVSSLKIASDLGKVRISLPVAFSALTGYTLYSHVIGSGGLLLALGVFLISCGSGALNHFQERKTDALMPRTQNRPIPSGRLSPSRVLQISAGYVVAGSAILAATFPVSALLLCWLTLIWYNLVYTPLKKVTAFAVLPGSVTGALPPLIGWVAAGGPAISENIWLVSGFFFLGQIPHFWLLLLLFGEEYSLAGFPNLYRLFGFNQIKRITFTWILAAIASALLVLFMVINNQILHFIMLFYILYLLFSLTLSFLVEKELRIRAVFYKLNFLYLMMMLFLIADSMVIR